MDLDVLGKLSSFKDLPQDWDSYGANPISLDAIALAICIILSATQQFGRECVHQVEAFPVPDGGVQLEWERPQMTLEIHILPGRKISLLTITGPNEKRQYEESGDVSLNEVYLAIGRVVSSGV